MAKPAPLTKAKIAGAGTAGVLALAAALIMVFEGDGGMKGYIDPVGVPTACYGHTGPDVVVGRRYTRAECQALLEQDMNAHLGENLACVTRPLPIETQAAFLSFSFNVGTPTFCRKFAPLINAGKTSAACAKLSLYVYAGNKKFRGLERRRAAERELCERGLAE